MDQNKEEIIWMQANNIVNEILILTLVVVAILIIYYITKYYKKPTKSKNNYLEALEHLTDGNYNWAIQKFKEVVREDTDNVQAYLRLGDLLRKKGLASNALKIHKDLMLRSNLSPAFKQKLEYSLLLDYEVLNDVKMVIKIGNNILNKYQDYSEEVPLRLAKYLEKDQEWEEAYNVLKKYNGTLPNELKRKLSLYRVFEGLNLLDKNEGRDARIKFREAMKLDESCASGYYYLGKSYYNENRLEDAIQAWKNLCQKIPKKAYIAFEALERTWFDLGKFTEAEKLYNDLWNKNPENVDAALALAEIFDKKGEQDAAVEVLNRLEENVPNNPRINGFRIQYLYNKNQYKMASTYAIEFFRGQGIISDKKFVCNKCNYQSNEPVWICPECKSIDTYNI
jgi:lipopolysaccharide biosynthesis regulator YciM